jgi:gas vesicle protein
MKNPIKVIGAALTGIIAGGVAGVLLAPEKGQETRKKLDKRSKKARKDFDGLVKKGQKRFKDLKKKKLV